MNLNPKKAVFCVSAASVLRALPFAATRDVRAYLHGVCVRPNPDGGALVMATNAAIACVFKDTTGSVGSARIIPTCPHLETALRKGGSVYGTADGLVWVTDAKGETCFILPKPAMDASIYPDLTNQISDPRKLVEGSAGGFDPSLIERLARGARAVRGPTMDSTALRFFHSPGSERAVITIGELGFAIAMPLRALGSPEASLAQALPAFMQRAKVSAIKPRRKTACAA